MPRRTVLVLMLLGCVLVACSGPGANGPRVLDEEAGAAELAERVDVVELIDVRTPEEHAAGSLAGARLIDVSAHDFRDRVDDLDRDASYLLYCRTGARSAEAAEIMAGMGFDDVASIGGYEALVAAGAESTG